MKKFVKSVTLIAFLVIALITIWAGTLAYSNKGEEIQESVEYTNLNWYIDFEWFNRVWGEDVVSKEIRDQTNVQIDFIVPGGTGSITRDLSIMIATNDLPDMVTLDSEDIRIQEMISSGQVYSIDELSNLYSDEIYTYLDNDIYEHVKQIDGRHYYYPNYAISENNFNHIKYKLNSNNALIVRKDIYNALGQPDFTTPEGFKNALKAAKELLPQTEYGPLIPIGFNEFQPDLNSLNFHLKSILGITRTSTLDPDYLEWIQTFREIYQDGLIPPEVFIDSRANIHKRIEQAQYFAMLFRYHDAEEALTALNSKNPEKMYIAVPGPKTKDDQANGNYYFDTDIDGWTVTLISKNCSDPEAAFRLMTYMISDRGQLCVLYGKEGSSFEYIDNKIRLLPEVEALKKSDREAYNNIYAGDNHYWMFTSATYQNEFLYTPVDGPLKQLREFKRGKVMYIDKDRLLISKSGINIPKNVLYIDDLKWNDTILKLITATTDEMYYEIMEEYKNFREDINID